MSGDDYRRDLMLQDQIALWDQTNSVIVGKVAGRSVRRFGTTIVSTAVKVAPTMTLRGSPVRRSLTLRPVKMGMCPGIGADKLFAATNGAIFVVYLPSAKGNTFAAVPIADVLDPRVKEALAKQP